MTTTRSTSSLHEFAAQLREHIALCSSGKTSRNDSSADEELNRMALELFALQFEHNAPYRKFCEARNVKPVKVKQWNNIPAIPAAGFKELELTCLAPHHRTTVFHSSGTTTQRPSRHFHSADSLAVYEASLLAWFTAHFVQTNTLKKPNGVILQPRQNPRLPLPKGEGRGEGEGSARQPNVLESDLCQFLFLTPTHSHARHSSLVHMFETVRRKFGSEHSLFTGQVETDGTWSLDLIATVSALREAIAQKCSVFLCGTAFNFVHLLDHLDDANLLLQLPAGSRVLETGGYKGRSRELPKAELHAWITDLLGVPASHIISEYGMSELSSQAYDGVAGAQTNDRVFHFPPWARVQIVSPETSREVGEGETGLIRIFDLANVYSVMAIQTEDLGIRRGNGFELLGRAALSEARGCSLMSI